MNNSNLSLKKKISIFCLNTKKGIQFPDFYKMRTKFLLQHTKTISHNNAYYSVIKNTCANSFYVFSK